MAKFAVKIVRDLLLAVGAFTVVLLTIMLGIYAALVGTFTIVSATVKNFLLEKVDCACVVEQSEDIYLLMPVIVRSHRLAFGARTVKIVSTSLNATFRMGTMFVI